MKRIFSMLVVAALIVVAIVASATPSMAEFASQAGYQYDSQYCTWEVSGPIVQGEAPNWECVPSGSAVPL